MTEMPTVENLLTETRWVRSLARNLAGPGCDEDDLVQDACLVALQRPPGHADNLRGWLQKVLTNLVRQGERSSRRRRQRELLRHGMRSDAEPAAAELVERAAIHRAVVDAVLALDEPYRSAILMRFFEDQSPRAIAARLEVPVATVRTRITRGLQRLRRQLDERDGGRQAWFAAVLALAAPPSLAWMTMKSKSILAGVAAIAALAVAYATIDWRSPPVDRSAAASDVRAERADLSQRSVAAGGGGRVDATPAEPVPSAVPAAAVEQDAPRIAGMLVDADGRALPQMNVALVAASGRRDATRLRVESGPDARFSLALDEAVSGGLFVDEPGWNTVMSAVVHRERLPRLALVVAARAVPLAGTVRDEHGRALADAEVRIAWPRDLRARLSQNSDAAAERHLVVRTAADGTFALDACAVQGAELVAQLPGLVPDRRPVPLTAERGIEIVLRQPPVTAGHVQGQVLDPFGALVADAHVAIGGRATRTDELGAFRIEAGDGASLVASATGHRRAEVARPAAGWPSFVVLQLGGEPLRIRGQVVDEHERGVAGAKVWVRDPTLLAGDGRPSVCEGVAAGCDDTEQLIARLRSGQVADPRRVFQTTPTTMWPFVIADADGAFELVGLEARDYGLRAMDMATLQMVDVDGVAAGSSGIRITMPAAARFARLAGVVAAADGSPVAGVTVQLQCDTISLAGSTMHGRTEQQVVTDERGRFELSNVPHAHVYLRLDGENILPVEFGRRVEGGLLALGGSEPENLRIVAERRMHVQVSLGERDEARQIEVHDVEGEPVAIDVFAGNRRSTTHRLSVQDGRSPVFVVPETATTLVLFCGEERVGSHALALRFGEVNRVDL